MIPAKVIFPDGKEAEYTFHAVPLVGQSVNLNKFMLFEADESEYPEFKPVTIRYRISHVAWDLHEDQGTVGHTNLRVILEPIQASYMEVTI